MSTTSYFGDAWNALLLTQSVQQQVDLAVLVLFVDGLQGLVIFRFDQVQNLLGGRSGQAGLRLLL